MAAKNRSARGRTDPAVGGGVCAFGNRFGPVVGEDRVRSNSDDTMKKTTIAAAGGIVIVVAAIAFRWRATPTVVVSPDDGAGARGVASPDGPGAGATADPGGDPARPTVSAAAVPLSPDKLERIAKIRRDYDEIRAKMSADYTAAGDKFPGGLSAFLKQLALLEREMHTDFALALTPRELEDYEMYQSTTGQAMQRRLAGVAVTDEQQRAVYRVQREFDDRFALVFDLSPPALWERMKAQDVARQKIRSVLSDEAFASWLNAEDPSFGAMRGLAAQKGLPAAAGNELWRIKSEWTLRKLEIAAQVGLSPEQRVAMHGALAGQTRARVAVLVGADALAPGIEALVWLPPVR